MNDEILDTQLPGFSDAGPDPLRQVEEAGFWLETYRAGVKADPLRMFQVVDRLDELVQAHRLELTREYLGAGGRQQTYRERRIWTAVVHLARELAAGYEASLQLFQAGAPNSPALAPLVPAITARAMRASPWCCAGPHCATSRSSRRSGVGSERCTLCGAERFLSRQFALPCHGWRLDCSA
jgi:hypothetical protein